MFNEYLLLLLLNGSVLLSRFFILFGMLYKVPQFHRQQLLLTSLLSATLQ